MAEKTTAKTKIADIGDVVRSVCGMLALAAGIAFIGSALACSYYPDMPALMATVRDISGICCAALAIASAIGHLALKLDK